MDHRTSARLELLGMAALLAALSPLCAARAEAEEIARIAVDRPAVVSIERTADGVVRLIVEFRPDGAPMPPAPAPSPPGKGPSAPAGTIAGAVADALASIPSGQAAWRARLLDAAQAEADRLRKAGAADPSMAAVSILGAIYLALAPSPDALDALGGVAADLATAIHAGGSSGSLGDRLREFAEAIERQKVQVAP